MFFPGDLSKWREWGEAKGEEKQRARCDARALCRRLQGLSRKSKARANGLSTKIHHQAVETPAFGSSTMFESWQEEAAKCFKNLLVVICFNLWVLLGFPLANLLRQQEATWQCLLLGGGERFGWFRGGNQRDPFCVSFFFFGGGSFLKKRDTPKWRAGQEPR